MTLTTRTASIKTPKLNEASVLQAMHTDVRFDINKLAKAGQTEKVDVKELNRWLQGALGSVTATKAPRSAFELKKQDNHKLTHAAAKSTLTAVDRAIEQRIDALARNAKGGQTAKVDVKELRAWFKETLLESIPQ